MTAINLNHYLHPPITVKKEYWGISPAIVLFLAFLHLIRLIDPAAAPLDSDLLSIVLMAAVSLLVFKAITGWLIKSIWPTLAKYSEDQFEQNFNALNPLQKVCIYLGFYLSLLFLFILSLSCLA